ncbi:MAG: UTP-glucose-1-phosphate uridylyltransferase [Parcubacteria group bacterium GW2011_GWA2_44_12]|nr:MAG: UTP-glucose-1-phosphate uridylyltransferase [Parcubacteria group bacterium GW2011_GWA2_44_12]
MITKITKAIIPVAGFGTRFLPATKVQPKEMLPVVDKPVIQYIVEEAVKSGIKDIIFITSQNKRAVEDHFDRNFELEHILKTKRKHALLKKIQSISTLANFFYVRQQSPLGDGHAILQAEKLINKGEAFAVLFGDDIIYNPGNPCLKQLAEVFKKYERAVIALEEIPHKDVQHYGVIKGEKVGDAVYKISGIVEKPSPRTAPSNLSIVGRYIVTRDIFDALAKVKKSPSGEIRFSDALGLLLKNQSVYGYQFEGKRYDCGAKLGFLKATVDLALMHEDLNGEFRSYLKQTAQLL